MGQTDGVDTHVLHEVEVGVVVFLREGGGHAGPFLMPRDTMEFHMFPVEEETFIGIDAERAETGFLDDTVYLLPVAHQRGLNGVEVWIGGALPQVRTLDGEGHDALIVEDVGTGLVGHHPSGKLSLTVRRTVQSL